jgi:beta-glucosidase-like glycosyl hydrolase
VTVTYRDPSRPDEVRVADLLARMTLEEKAAQVAAPFAAMVDVHRPPLTGWGNVTAALSVLDAPPQEAARAANELQRKHVEDTRLGIPVLIAEEALLGLKVRGATVFPDAIAQAATWQPELIEDMAAAIGQQMALLGVRQALSPLADVARDPRWGRVDETYGEDPYLVGSMATAYVRGLQRGDGSARVIATLKHFVGYSASDGGRNTGAAHLGERELREVHAAGFEMAIRAGGARGVMPSYNSVDGVPVTGSRTFLQDLLRDELGFTGLVISDLGAVDQLHTKHRTAQDSTHAHAQAIAAGVDLDLDNGVSSEDIVAAVRSYVLDEADLDRAVSEVLRTKFRLGLFERPYVDVDRVPESLDPDDTRALARRIAEQSVILLRNEVVGGTPLLPLDPGLGTIAVIGPNADRPMGQLGTYSYPVLDSVTRRFAAAADPQARPEDRALLERMRPDDAELLVTSVPIVTFLEGIRRRVGDHVVVLHEPGCQVATDDRSGFPAAAAAAANADVAIVVVGDQAGINGFGTVGEGLDSSDCALPGVQRELIEEVVATGTPTIVVLSHGRPFVLGWMAERVPAIVSAFFGGEEVGNAVAAVLFGDVNPAGRLPIALLRSAGSAPAPYGGEVSARAYVDGQGGPLFPFGHGLSYTTFEYANLVVDPNATTAGALRLSFTVANTGSRPGDEVVQVYGQDVVARTARPARKLVAFRRVRLEPGAGARLSATIPAAMFALWDPTDGWVVEPGVVKLHIGSSSRAIHLRTQSALDGPEHYPGPDRELASEVLVEHLDATGLVAATVATPPAVALTDDSTVLEWLEHPVGRPLLLRGLGAGDDFDDNLLERVHGIPLRQLVDVSSGWFTLAAYEDAVAGATRSGAYTAS